MCLVMVIDPDPGPGKPGPKALICSFATCRLGLSQAEVPGSPDNQPFSMWSVPTVSKLLVHLMQSNCPPRRVPAQFPGGPAPSSDRFVANKFQIQIGRAHV